MRESSFSRKLTGRLNNWGSCDRIENAVGQGNWDIFVVVEGQANWIETKVIHNNEIYMERFQLPWATRHHKSGFTNLFLLAAFDEKKFRVYDYPTLIGAPKSVYKKWTVLNLDDMSELAEITSRTWDELRLYLSSKYTCQ